MKAPIRRRWRLASLAQWPLRACFTTSPWVPVLTIAAFTPIPAALMAVATSLSEPVPTEMLWAVEPTVIVMLPDDEMTSLALATLVAVATPWVVARRSTVNCIPPTVAPSLAVAVATAVSETVALRTFHPVERSSAALAVVMALSFVARLL